MLSSAKIGTSSWRYYQREVATDPAEYFLAHGEAPGRWWGRGLIELGLGGGAVVEERELEALLARGLHPHTGEALGRAWRRDGVTGYDLTFSAPKSVSALWAIGGSAIGSEIADAHRAAVRAALDFLDAHAALSRKGIDGISQIDTAGFAAAVFDHRTSRAGDPQLHSHALVVNKLRCADGQWRTIDGHEIYHHKKAAGALYQAALRAELVRRLGVSFDAANRHGQAEIAGVPAQLMRLWSKRARQVDADAAPVLAEFERELGRAVTAAERGAVVKTSVLKTRPRKRHDEQGALHTRWAEEGARAGCTGPRLLRAVLDAARGQARPATDLARVRREITHGAVATAGTRSATFSHADVVVQVAAALPVAPVSAAQVRAEVEALTDQALRTDQAVPVGTARSGTTVRRSDSRWATAALLATEARILRLAQLGTAAGRGVVPQPLADQQAARAGLDDEQRAALEQLVTGGQMVAVLVAPAGAGKTATIGAAARAWTAAGYDVVGLAPSARAAAELARATGAPADTVAKWRYEQDRTGLRDPEDSWRPGPRTVLVVDEAAMLGTDDLHALTSAAAAAKAKLVLVGDPAQIGPVERAGGLLPALAARVGAIELIGVRRFTHTWEAHATKLLRHGNPAIWTRYAQHQRVHPAPDADAALDAVHARWQAALADGHDALMMARARADVDELNRRARAAALAAGNVHGPVLAHAGGRDWQVGDLLRARRNDRRLRLGDGHVRNGDRFRIVGASAGGALIAEDLAGRGRTALPSHYLAAYADYGWASTIDGAQGATAHVGILLARAGLDREHLYVGMTRGRDGNHVHVVSEPVDDDTAHILAPRRSLPTLEDATRVLEAATIRAGAQEAAHTLLDRARIGATAHAQTQDAPPLSPSRAQPPATATYSPRRWRRPATSTATPSAARSIGM